MLANEWDSDELEDWGLDLPDIKADKELINDLLSIELPFYTPSEIIPNVADLADMTKTETLIERIDALECSDELKKILRIRAAFFTDFDFQKIADYFYNQDNEIRDVMKQLGMVIVAPKEAVELGFANLIDYLIEE